mmetsp:Transcript_7360/g.13854  ORF Transcript_7360/g.13854 Transcript_7360/m.13854 type:complete len:357 (+) Transcript_7360:572-1642(+)
MLQHACVGRCGHEAVVDDGRSRSRDHILFHSGIDHGDCGGGSDEEVELRVPAHHVLHQRLPPAPHLGKRAHRLHGHQLVRPGVQEVRHGGLDGDGELVALQAAQRLAQHRDGRALQLRPRRVPASRGVGGELHGHVPLLCRAHKRHRSMNQRVHSALDQSASFVQHQLGHHPALRQQRHQTLGAHCSAHFLVVADGQVHRALEGERRRARQEALEGVHHHCARVLHVDGAAPPHEGVVDVAREGRVGPRRLRAGLDGRHVQVTKQQHGLEGHVQPGEAVQQGEIGHHLAPTGSVHGGEHALQRGVRALHGRRALGGEVVLRRLRRHRCFPDQLAELLPQQSSVSTTCTRSSRFHGF